MTAPVATPPAAYIDIGGLVSQTPGLQGGQPCIVRPRMRVRTIVDLTMMGMSPGAIVEEYESILLNGVHGALAFYHANQDRLDAEWVAQDIEADRLETETRAMQGPSLRERLGV